MTFVRRSVFALLLSVALAACSSQPPASNSTSSATPAAAPAATAPAAAAADDAPLPNTPSPFDALPEAVRGALDKPFTGDYDEMLKRRLIRVGVTFNRTHYFVDEGQERGITYESVKDFETNLNKDLKTGNLKLHVAMIPMSREQLAPALRDGKIDMVAAMVTVRPDLEKIALFSTPTRTNVNEVVVTGPGAPKLASVDDLAGQEVFIRKTSPYYEALTHVNADLVKRGKAAIIIDEAPDALEDDDILEMVNSGLAPITIVDDYLANFWKQIFTKLNVHENIAVRTGGNLAIAFRPNNPKLRDAVNGWLKDHQKGDAFRNTIERRYLQNIKYAKSATAESEREKLAHMVTLFEKYGKQYNIDYLLMAAQGYQESTLDQTVKSPVGAIGVMQVMPATGKELAVGDINQIEPNVHAGVKYVRFMMDQYFKDEPMDQLNKGLMTFASYNAGPGRIRQLRREAKQRGLDPNVWFGNVERIASERIGRETVTYVSNIYKYYVAYKLLSTQAERKAAARTAVAK
ncbi:MAG TPA: transporter substrate-binding domain-containing protein [Vicinamibacterales bacterium]